MNFISFENILDKIAIKINFYMKHPKFNFNNLLNTFAVSNLEDRDTKLRKKVLLLRQFIVSFIALL